MRWFNVSWSTWADIRSCVSGLSIRLLAGVLSQLDFFLGHDSGVTHLAALLGTPTVALFGPTEPARWAPRGRAVMVIREKPCRCASWDAVRNCIEKPCLELSPAAILAACRTIRHSRRKPSDFLSRALSPH